jgi:outer membrane protein assembly factor BamA
VKVGTSAVFNHRDFEHAPGESDPSIEKVYDTSKIEGFDAGVHTVELDGNLIVDLRDSAGATSNGFYFEGFGGAVPRVEGYRYGHYGAEATGYIDLYKKTRVLVIRAVHEAVVGDFDQIPFSDLPRLGGPHRLRGFELDRFRDKTSMVATLEYHYPIHANIAGSLFMDAGHVGEDYAALMRLRDWHLGGGGGFIFQLKDRILFTFDIAYGDGVQVYLTTDPLRAFAHRDSQL